MKNSPCARLLGALFAVVASFITASSAHAQILLKINDSDPTAVVITATASAASGTIANYEIYYGIELANFFSGRTSGYDDGSTGATALNATIHTGSLTLDRAGADYGVSGLDVHNDLSLFSDTDNGADTIGFAPDQTAFTGTVTFNLNDVAATFRGWENGNALRRFQYGGIQGPIGSYEIVNTVEAPEPSTCLLLVGSVVALPLLRRLRRT